MSTFCASAPARASDYSVAHAVTPQSDLHRHGRDGYVAQYAAEESAPTCTVFCYKVG